jgi:hypothetical protein
MYFPVICIYTTGKYKNIYQICCALGIVYHKIYTNTFRRLLEKNNHHIKNLVGICVNNWNIMLEEQNLWIFLLLRDNTKVAVFPCICHCMRLVAHHVCESLSINVEQLLHLICCYYSRKYYAKGQSPLEGTEYLVKATR